MWAHRSFPPWREPLTLFPHPLLQAAQIHLPWRRPHRLRTPSCLYTYHSVIFQLQRKTTRLVGSTRCSHALPEVCFLHNGAGSTRVATCVSAAIPSTHRPGDAGGSADTRSTQGARVVTLGACSYRHSRQKLGTSSTSQRQDTLSAQRHWPADTVSGPQSVCCPWFLDNWCSGTFLHLKF